MLLAVLALAPAMTRIAAQEQPAQPAPAQAASAATNPSTAETPKQEESQEESFLNAPVVGKFASALHLKQSTAKYLFLAINFAIIALAIVIPLARTMPKILRKRRRL